VNANEILITATMGFETIIYAKKKKVGPMPHLELHKASPVCCSTCFGEQLDYINCHTP